MSLYTGYRDEVRDFITRLTSMHAEAHRIGLYRTGHKLHDAVREVGWEYSDQIAARMEPGEET